jgi:hypothetical protein
LLGGAFEGFDPFLGPAPAFNKVSCAAHE